MKTRTFPLVSVIIFLSFLFAVSSEQIAQGRRMRVVYSDLSKMALARSYIERSSYQSGFVAGKDPVTIDLLNTALGNSGLNDRQVHEDFSRAGLTLVSYGKFFSDLPVVKDSKTGEIVHPEVGLYLPGYPTAVGGGGYYAGGHLR